NPSGRPALIKHVRELARTHTEAAIEALAEIAFNPEELGITRVAACKELLNRAWGKAPSDVRVEMRGAVVPVESLTPAQREAEIARLQELRKRAEVIDIAPPAELDNGSNVDS